MKKYNGNVQHRTEQRDYRIFEEFTFYMILESRKRRIQKIFELGGHVYAFDAFVHITEVKVHDSKAMQEIPYKKGAITSSIVAITISATFT